MSLDDLDTYLTTNPDDADLCMEHARFRPCRECQIDEGEARAEQMREEGA